MATGDALKNTKALAAGIVGFVAPGASFLIYAVTDQSAGSTVITTGEWITAGCMCLVTAGAAAVTVQRVENKAKAL